MGKVKIFIRARDYHSNRYGRDYRAGSVQFVDPDEAAELVKDGIAIYADPPGTVRTAMAVGPAARTAEQAAAELEAARAAAQPVEEAAEKKGGKRGKGKASEEG